MTKIRIFAASAAACLLAACATPVPTTVHEDVGKGLIAAETVVDAAAVAATVAVKAGVTSKAQDATIARLTAACPDPANPDVKACPVRGSLILARRAYAASDAATMGQLAGQLTAFAAELDAAH